MWPPQPGQSCCAGYSTRSRSGRARANNLAISCLQKQSKHHSLNARASQLRAVGKKGAAAARAAERERVRTLGIVGVPPIHHRVSPPARAHGHLGGAAKTRPLAKA